MMTIMRKGTHEGIRPRALRKEARSAARRTCPTPELRDDEVLVAGPRRRREPAGLQDPDGEFKLILPYRLPLILGHDVAGVVVKVGPRVRQFKPGDEVYARVG